MQWYVKTMRHDDPSRHSSRTYLGLIAAVLALEACATKPLLPYSGREAHQPRALWTLCGVTGQVPPNRAAPVQFPVTPSTDRNRPLLTNGDIRSSGYADPPLPGGANVGAVLRQSSATVRAAKRRLETTPFCSVLRLKFEALNPDSRSSGGCLKTCPLHTVKAVRAG